MGGFIFHTTPHWVLFLALTEIIDNGAKEGKSERRKQKSGWMGMALASWEFLFVHKVFF